MMIPIALHILAVIIAEYSYWNGNLDEAWDPRQSFGGFMMMIILLTPLAWPVAVMSVLHWFWKRFVQRKECV